MEYFREARFPFLREAASIAERNDVDVETLVSSPSFDAARQRGLDRVLDAIKDSEVSYTSLTGSDYDRLMEIMSYPYARILISAVNDRFLTKRYALAEAVRMNRLLGEENPTTVVTVSEELGVSTTQHDGELRMHFTDFVKFSVRIKSPDWKLVNTEVHDGYVTLHKDRFYRVLQNALQDRIEEELPLPIPAYILEFVKQDIDHVRVVLGEMKGRYSPTSGDISIENFPPCMRVMLASAQNGVNLPHSGRFALVSFLHTIGMNSEQILTLFSESPDFDASKSSYQIKHITGELTGGQEYTPPECSTMKSYGICFEPDNICEKEWLNHPLKYYRLKSRPREQKEEKK